MWEEWRFAGATVAGLAFAAELVTLGGSALAALVAGSAPYLWPFPLIALILQVLTIRREIARVVVAVSFFALFLPYWWLADPRSHVQLSAANVAGEILEDLQRGSIDDAASRFCNDDRRRDFVAAVEEHQLLGLRSWSLVKTDQAWENNDGSAEFNVVRSDGEPRFVEIGVYTRPFQWSLAYSVTVRRE